MSKLLHITYIIFFLILHLCSVGQSSSYRIRYASTKRYFTAHEHLQTSDNSTVLVGKWGDREYPSDLLVIKIDAYGELIWSKRVTVDIRLYTYTLCELNDGSIVCVADIIAEQPPYISTLYIVKLSCKGELIWSKTMSRPGNTNHRFSPMSVKAGKDNDIIVSFFNDGSTQPYMVICRINQSGDFVWCKTFYGEEQDATFPTVSFYKDGKITSFGYKKIYSNYPSSYTKVFFAMNLNYENGSIEDFKAYQYSDYFTGGALYTNTKVHFDAEQLTDGSFVLFGILAAFTQTDCYFYRLVLNADLTVKQAKQYTIPKELGTVHAKLRVFSNGNTSFISSNYNTFKDYWYIEDSNGNKIRSLKAPYAIANSYVDLQYRSVQSGANKSMRLLSIQANSKGCIDLTVAEDTDTNINSCIGADTSFIKTQTWKVTPTTLNWKSISSNEFTLSSRADQQYDIPSTKEVICSPPTSRIKPFEITGNETVCAPELAGVYSVKTKNGKPLNVQWSMDPKYYQSMTKLNDSTISIKFKEIISTSQEVKLHVFVGNCQITEDSLSISLLPERNKLADTLLYCTTPIRLQPGNLFKSYYWQDGSTDSVFLVDKPGKYRVTVQTFCNKTYTDSVLVLSNTTGINTKAAMCMNDTLTLTAPNGFVDYKWTPNYKMILLSENSIRVFPEKDMDYILSTFSIDGCRLKDTIALTIHKAKSINLAKDIVICKGDQFTLNAGNGFRTYSWNTGSTTQSYTTNSSGAYSVRAIDENGCLASDTTYVITKVCYNRIYIPNAFTPNNDGKNDFFKTSVEGRIEAYELKVYNRWGTVVFTTTLPNHGWNGFYKGLKQNTGTYVWVCTYKFANESSKRETGTITIIP